MVASALSPPKAIGYKVALEKMRRHGVRLVRMRASNAEGGFAHYVVPGGYVESATAQKLKEHPFMRANEDGLFPGHDQTWTMMTDEPVND